MRARLNYSNVVSTLALIAALAGGTTAVAVKTKLPKNSVTTKSIKKGAVTAKSLRNGSVTASKLADVQVVTSQLSGVGALAPCPAGTRLLSGGGEATVPVGSTGVIPGLVASRPQGNAWFANGRANSVTYALCLSKIPGK
ncbi:MAG: hypothetical protein ACRDL6_01225 [Solirubrobacterales bacterium]